MKTILLSLLVSALTIPVFAANKNEKKPRTPNSEVSEQLVAQKYLEVADVLAQARLAGKTCDVNAYTGRIVEMFMEAKNIDAKIQATSAMKQALSDNLAFRLAETNNMWNLEKLGGSYPEVLVGTRFTGGVSSFYPQTLTLLANGKLIFSEYQLDSKGEELVEYKHEGTWKYIARSEKHRYGSLVTQVPNYEKKMKTRSYSLTYADGSVDLYKGKGRAFKYQPEGMMSFSTQSGECGD